MPNILDEIVTAKREELAVVKASAPLYTVQERAAQRPAPLSLAGALRSGEVRLIAEVKKASPSRGLLCPDFDPVQLAAIYAGNGASAISVLTDPRFQGEPEHLSAIKESGVSAAAPVLRKDFIFDPYQVYEARAMGADTYLLIVAILSASQLGELLALGRDLGMDALVEVHDENELQVALDAGAEIIGINNRDLRTFNTDLATTKGLAPLIPGDKVIVSESGIFTPEHLQRLGRLGVNAVLVGEALVTAPDTAAKVRELTAPVAVASRPWIRAKICGIQRTEDAITAAEAGADFIGLVFVPERRRRLEVVAAAEIVSELRTLVPEPPRVVGLFADQPLDKVVETIKSCSLDLAQLCGRESPDYCREVTAQTGAEIIKVLHVSVPETVGDTGNGGDVGVRMAPYLKAGCYITLDRLVEGLQGGTGQSFDWEVAAQLSRRGFEFLLAGGLTPENVTQAVKQVNPWGVDVSSGVETGGRQDEGKIRAFIRNARAAV